MVIYCNGDDAQITVTRTGLRIQSTGLARNVSFFDVVEFRQTGSKLIFHTPLGRFEFTGQTGQLLADVRKAFFEFYIELRAGDLLYAGAPPDGGACAICLAAEREEGGDWALLKCCGNLVHLQCMKDILKWRLPCPFCRSTVCKFCNGSGCDGFYSLEEGL